VWRRQEVAALLLHDAEASGLTRRHGGVEAAGHLRDGVLGALHRVQTGLGLRGGLAHFTLFALVPLTVAAGLLVGVVDLFFWWRLLFFGLVGLVHVPREAIVVGVGVEVEAEHILGHRAEDHPD